MGYSKVSRAALFESEKDEGDYVPIEMDIVEVEQADHMNEEIEEKQDDEFDFPLFSFGGVTEKKEESKEEERGRCSNVMKVTLRDRSEERVENERPQEYYFAKVSDQKKQEYESVAVSGEDILKGAKEDPFKTRGIVVDLNKHNTQIDQESHVKRRRPGKNQRIARIEAGRRNQERHELVKKLEAEKEAKLLKKRFHKRGGKKNKKKTETATTTKDTVTSGPKAALVK